MRDETTPYPSYRWLVLPIGIVGSITFGASLIALAPILGEVAMNLGIDTRTALNFFSAYGLMGTIVMIRGGVVWDRWRITIAIVLGLLCASLPAVLMPWLGHVYSAAVLFCLIQGSWPYGPRPRNGAQGGPHDSRPAHGLRPQRRCFTYDL